jgi:hypothetical protein
MLQARLSFANIVLTLQGPPAGKRRKRMLSTNEEFVSRAVDPQQILGETHAINQFNQFSSLLQMPLASHIRS